MAVKICKKCGESNYENATSCISCGESLLNNEVIGVDDEEKFSVPLPERCPNCDKTLDGKHSICPYCGTHFNQKPDEDFHFEFKSDYPKVDANTGIYILSFFIPLAGIIIGAIWLASDDKKDSGKTAMTWAVIGIIVGIILSMIVL